MNPVPAIPESTKASLTYRLHAHAAARWPQLAEVHVRYQGTFAYVSGELPDGRRLPLFRLRYGGSAHHFGFALYLAGKDGYEDQVLPSGLAAGSPQEALDCACALHLAAPDL